MVLERCSVRISIDRCALVFSKAELQKCFVLMLSLRLLEQKAYYFLQLVCADSVITCLGDNKGVYSIHTCIYGMWVHLANLL